MKGFRPDAWLACLAYILLWPAVFSVTNLVLFYFNTGQTESEHLNYGWNLLIFLAGVAQQGQENAPSPLTARIVFIYMMLASVVLFESFNASYTSFLSVVNIFNPFQTLQDLEQTSFIIGAQEGTAYRNMFIVSQDKCRAEATSNFILKYFSLLRRKSRRSWPSM